MSQLTTRRAALRTLLQIGAGAAALPLISSRMALGGVASQCPGGDASIDWVPDVMRPVAAGFQDLGVADGAPGPVRVWYPSAEATWVARDAKLLDHCTARWPLVLFLHGAEPCRTPLDPEYYQRWKDLPVSLARSGYVVLVPAHPQDAPVDGRQAPFVCSFIDWARNDWKHAASLDPRFNSNAVAGHSFGGLLSAHVARIRDDISAFVSLSGVFGGFGGPDLISAFREPTFFMWSVSAGEPEDLDVFGLWNSLRCHRYGCRFDGGHFDYIRFLGSECGERPGECHVTKHVAADLVTLFLSRTMPVPGSTTRIPFDLQVPDVPLTSPRQQSFGSARLMGLRLLAETADRACNFELRWKLNALQGTRRLDPQP